MLSTPTLSPETEYREIMTADPFLIMAFLEGFWRIPSAGHLKVS